MVIYWKVFKVLRSIYFRMNCSIVIVSIAFQIQYILIVFSDENDKINKIAANDLISHYHDVC